MDFLANLLTYMGVFNLVKTMAFYLDGISDHCIFMSPLLLLLKGKVITSRFFLYVPSPWNRSQKRKGNQRGQMTIISIEEIERIFFIIS